MENVRAWANPRLDIGRHTGRALVEPPVPRKLTPWLALEQLNYSPVNDNWGLVRLVAGIDPDLGSPARPRLVVQRQALGSSHAASSSVVAPRPADDPAGS